MLALMSGLVFFSCNLREKADLIIFNANIYLVDADFQLAQSMAVKNGRVLAVGSETEIRKHFRAAREEDMGGQFVYPGLIDPHSHYMGYAMNLLRADLFGSESMEEIAARLQKHALQHPALWVQGRGWDQNLFAIKQMPDNQLLNAAFPDRPVYIIRVDGHAAVANEVALAMAGITADTRIEGGEVVVRHGKPTGLLIDRAMGLVASQIPAPTQEEYIQLLQQAQQNIFAVGLTSVSDAGLAKSQVLLLDSLLQAQALQLRVYVMLNPTEENFEYFLPRGPFMNDQLTIRSVKLFADGALGSRGAKLLTPYSDDPGNTGLIVDDPGLMRKACELALKHGFQVNTHCIGDSAVRLMLHLYAEQLPEGNDLRWRIEHAQVVAPDNFSRFGQYGIVPSIQAVHAVSDMLWAPKRLGNERIRGAYAYRDLIAQLGWLPNGSDFPVEQINPLYSFHAAFTRKDQHGMPAEGFMMEQALTREEALRGMTIWAAKANFEESLKGSLEVGKLADFVVFDQDLMQVDETAIYDLKVRQTWLGGAKVYEWKD